MGEHWRDKIDRLLAQEQFGDRLFDDAEMERISRPDTSIPPVFREIGLRNIAKIKADMEERKRLKEQP